MLPAQKASATRQGSAVVSLAEDKTIRGAKTALHLAILAVIPLVSTFLFVVAVQVARLNGDYSLRGPLTLVGLSLAGICGLSDIVIGTRGLRAARRNQAIPMRTIRIARIAVFLGSIAGGIAIFYIIVLVAVINGFYVRA